jgi:hypothetical protein
MSSQFPISSPCPFERKKKVGCGSFYCGYTLRPYFEIYMLGVGTLIEKYFLTIVLDLFFFRRLFIPSFACADSLT